MRTISVRDLMVPVEAYATVSQDATLNEAVLALETAQLALDPSRHKHRAILVLDDNGKVVGKIVMKNILIALEPNYGKMEGMGVLERSGYSPELIKSMLEDKALWTQPLEFVCARATTLKVRDFVEAPSEDEYIDENATLGEAIHQLVVCPYHSLLVTSGDEVGGILRLSDVFTKVCDAIKTCRP
ncbi:MAG: CBS domain-containing protein [Deltaproteobacteria bacterium]|nr:CBS domain-containing protein [Deltaproteobacteria bacterium]